MVKPVLKFESRRGSYLNNWMSYLGLCFMMPLMISKIISYGRQAGGMTGALKGILAAIVVLALLPTIYLAMAILGKAPKEPKRKMPV